MKIHTTNYQDTFIEVAEDCPVSVSEIPPQKNIHTIADMQYEMISKHPYQFTSDDVIFETYAQKNNFTETEKPEERSKLFSKGQVCLRSSSLAKRYGFGFHHNHEGKVALFPVESQEYKNFINDNSLKKVKAMRSKRN